MTVETSRKKGKRIHTVGDLIRVLQGCDPDLPLAIANLNSCSYVDSMMLKPRGRVRVGLLNTHSENRHIVIGHFGDRNLNYPNYWVERMLDGRDELPWGR